MNMKTKILIFLTILSLVGCSKDDPKPPEPASLLPPETQTGANTFGCLINGKLLIPRNGSGSFGGSDSGMILWGGNPNGNEYNEIDVHDYKSNRTGSIFIHIQSLDQLGVGNYVIDESNGNENIDGLNHNYIHCRIFNETTNSYQFYISYTNSGLLKITRFEYVPSVKRMVSGTFSCRVRSTSNPSDEMEVTLGRFDIDNNTLLVKVFP